MGISVFPVPSAGGTSSQLPAGGTSIWADGNITSATATITKAMPAGQYIVTSPSAVTVTTNGGFTTTATRNTPTTLNVTSSQTSATVVPEFVGTAWTTSANTTNGSGLTPAIRAYASTIGRHVILFDNNTNQMAYSADGFDNWITGNMPSTTNWQYLAASPTRFIACVETSSNDTIAYSDDGINWSSANMGVGFNKSNVIHSSVGNLFIIGSGSSTSTYYTSSAGTSWQARSMPSAGEWKFSVANNILFGTNASYNTNGATSTNGTSWTAFTFPTDQNWFKVVYANGVYVATTRYGGPSATSTNGSTWTLRTSPTPPSGGSYGDTIVAGGVFLVVYTNTGSIAQSADGINWRYQSSSPGVRVGNGYLSIANGEVYGLSNTSPVRSTKTFAQPYASGQYFSISAGPVAPTY
jgi:hypothetical protein